MLTMHGFYDDLERLFFSGIPIFFEIFKNLSKVSPSLLNSTCNLSKIKSLIFYLLSHIQ